MDEREKSSFIFPWRWSNRNTRTQSSNPCTSITSPQLSRRKWNRLLKRFIIIQLRSIRKFTRNLNTKNRHQFTRKKFHMNISIITTNTFIPTSAVRTLTVIMVVTLEVVMHSPTLIHKFLFFLSAIKKIH